MTWILIQAFSVTLSQPCDNHHFICLIIILNRQVWRIWPLGEMIHHFMNAFTDHRDSDLLIVRYVPLLCMIIVAYACKLISNNLCLFCSSFSLATFLSYWDVHCLYGFLLDLTIVHLHPLLAFWALELEIQWWVSVFYLFS